MIAPIRVWVVEREEGDGWTPKRPFFSEGEADFYRRDALTLWPFSERRVTEHVALPVAEYEAMRRDLEAGRETRLRIGALIRMRGRVSDVQRWDELENIADGHDAAAKGGG